VTDHNTLGGRGDGLAGLRDGVFVLVGYEHNDPQNLNHYLAFGTPEVANAAAPQDYINRVKEMGGIGFIAHPVEKRDYLKKSLPPFPWTEWGVTGFDGIELWNQMSDWLEQLRGPQSFMKIVFPHSCIREAPQELLEKWDEMNKERFVSAIGSVDAHSWFAWGPFRNIIFHINGELRGIRAHYYVDAADWDGGAAAERALLSAMKDGRGFMSNYRRGDARGTRIYIKDANGAEVYPGRQSINISYPAAIYAEFPEKARITLIRNGTALKPSCGKTAAWQIDGPGVYRIEACRRRGAWIYSNPFPVGRYPL
jgi:hypothetical protein